MSCWCDDEAVNVILGGIWDDHSSIVLVAGGGGLLIREQSMADGCSNPNSTPHRYDDTVAALAVLEKLSAANYPTFTYFTDDHTFLELSANVLDTATQFCEYEECAILADAVTAINDAKNAETVLAAHTCDRQ